MHLGYVALLFLLSFSTLNSEVAVCVGFIVGQRQAPYSREEGDERGTCFVGEAKRYCIWKWVLGN